MKQGLTPDNPAIPGIQSDQISSVVSSRTCQSNQPTHRLSPIGSILAKSVLFACSQCDGPLVPSSYCIVCKKITIRSCANCGTTRDMGIHDSCKNLILLGNEVSTLSNKKSKETSN